MACIDAGLVSDALPIGWSLEQVDNWFGQPNSRLNDQTPTGAIADGEIEAVIRAARAEH